MPDPDSPDIRIVEQLIVNDDAWCDACLAAELDMELDAIRDATRRLVAASLLFLRWRGRCARCQRPDYVTGRRTPR